MVSQEGPCCAFPPRRGAFSSHCITGVLEKSWAFGPRQSPLLNGTPPARYNSTQEYNKVPLPQPKLIRDCQIPVHRRGAVHAYGSNCCGHFCRGLCFVIHIAVFDIVKVCAFRPTVQWGWGFWLPSLRDGLQYAGLSGVCRPVYATPCHGIGLRPKNGKGGGY